MTDGLRRRALVIAALALGVVPLQRASAANAHVSGSVYVDYWGVPGASTMQQAPAGVTPEGSLKVTADINEDLGFSAKACFSCHGLEVEHLMLEYTPRTWFNVQAGRIAIPFGEYSNRVDPSGHVAPSAPLVYDMGRMAYGSRSAFNLGVVPMPYVDTGVLLYGQRWVAGRLQVWYGGYATAGMRGGNDLDFVAMRAISYSDNNKVPSGGGRLALTWAQADPGGFLGDVSVGGSFTGGRYDATGSRSYSVWGVDASGKLGPITVRAEYASRRTDLDLRAGGYPYEVIDPWFEKTGWYGEIEAPLGKYLTALYRADQLRRQGVPLPSSTPSLSTDSRITRHTAALMVTPTASLFVKADYEYWKPTDFAELHTFHLGMGGAF